MMDRETEVKWQYFPFNLCGEYDFLRNGAWQQRKLYNSLLEQMQKEIK